MADGAGQIAEVHVSKTDKTRPIWVKITEYHREHHDHSNGPCDLPELGSADATGFRRGRNCYWDADWDNPEFRCGCGMCGWPSRSKQLRQEGKRQARDWQREY